jgi:hypothetical protein
MEEETGAAPKKNRQWIVIAVCASVLIIIILFAFAYIFGFMGSSCNCGPFPRFTATTDGDAIVISYTGVWSDREGAWFIKRLPDEESRLTGFHYRVTPGGGTEIRQDHPAPGPGQDQTVRFEHAATPGKDHVIVIADESDGTSTVVYDNEI